MENQEKRIASVLRELKNFQLYKTQSEKLEAIFKGIKARLTSGPFVDCLLKSKKET